MNQQILVLLFDFFDFFYILPTRIPYQKTGRKNLKFENIFTVEE